MTKLLKLIKQPKIITKQSNKIKVYTKSKTADCPLQLDLIKRHIITKKMFITV